MKKTLTAALLGTMLSVTADTSDSPLILHPAISPDASQIAFTYQGDIWSVPLAGGKASRLTIHEGYDRSPTWSKDGNHIAFSSDRYGNYDVFIMPDDGGRPTRLTYHSSSDVVTGFSNNNEVLFNSRRIYAQVERTSEIMAVSQKGGSTEFRYMDSLGTQAVVSPDGNKVAFVRGGARVSREDYRGPANRDVWIYDIEKDSYTQLTDFQGADIMPRWATNDELYFISSRAGKYNVFKTRLNGSAEQVTFESNFGVEYFSIDNGANNLVYQAADKLAVVKAGSKQASALSIQLAGDLRFDPVTNKTTTNNINQYAISPNGKLAAYVLRGDIYVTRNDKDDKRSVRLTTGADRDRDVTWLNDETLLFVSDRNGQNDIFALTSDDADEKNLFQSMKHKVTAITNTDAQERLPIVAPSGDKLVYMQGRGKLISAEISDDLELSSSTTLLDGWATPNGISWSPDSNWLAYSLSDLSFNHEVFIHAADNSKEPVNVSMHPKYDAGPVWSPDGSKLGFVSMRNNGDFDVWFAWLTENDWQRSQEEWKRKQNMDEPKGKGKGKGKEEKKDESKDESKDEDKSDEKKDDKNKVEPIKIDLDGIYQRLVQVTRYAGNESEIAFDKKGEHIYFAIGGSGRQNYEVARNLYKIKWDGEKKKTVIGGNKNVRSLSLTNDGKSLYALTGRGQLVQVNTKSDKPQNLTVTSRQTIEHLAERAQIFDEAWGALNAGFYDPNFHGKDWDALKEKYRPLALKASTKEDFQYVFNLMLGQVNASHMGLFRGENQKQTQNDRTGLLGLELRPAGDGLRVTDVLPNSPAARIESLLKVDDIITEVNQQPVAEGNFYSMLNNQADQPVLLSIQRGGEQEEVVIWPTASLSNALYDDWVNTRRELTDKFSDGKLGYLHIRGMNWTSFERFERELMAAGYGKEGIVIDVRYNGGGWTTDYLMAVLNVRQHAYTIPRGAAENLERDHKKFAKEYPYSERLPLSAWTKPSIAMSNEASYSNAEIFSHAYRNLGIGKVVGRPTFGAVISTGAAGLVDGSVVRMPFRGWWVKATGENMDFTPAKPDIEVFNPPAYKANGVDPQLERAVEELLKEL